jgi:hypothetical protein
MRIVRSAGVFVRSIAGGGRLARTDSFELSAPSAQTAVDAAPAQWASRLPIDGVRAGTAELFDDKRIRWAFERLGGVEGMRVLDLGPLDGGFSYMAQRAGAAAVVGVEANRNAFAKCLITKELLGLDRCTFLCGDVIGYLEGEEVGEFDLCIGSGILYHMVNPMLLIALISRHAKRLTIWTHIEDESSRGGGQAAVYEDFRYELHRHDYGVEQRLTGFWGGTQRYSNWLTRTDLLGALEHFGWQDIEIAFDDPQHQNGPALALVAVRGA